MHMNLAALGAAALLHWLPGAAMAAEPLPVAPVQDTADVLHGVTVKDPYRGFENMRSTSTQQWLKAQGRHASEVLSRIPGRDAMQLRIEALAKSSGDQVRQVLRMPGERIFYLRRLVNEGQYKLVMREGLQGAVRVLVDPEVLAKATGVPHAINYFMPSWDGRVLAYGVSAGGSEEASLHLLDIRSGKPLGTPIPRAVESAIAWSPDSRSLLFNQLREPAAGAPESEHYMDSTVLQLTVQPRVGQPRPVFGPLVNRELKLDRLDVGSVVFDPHSRFMVARTTDTTLPEGKLFIAPVSALRGKGPIPWRQISRFEDKITAVALRRDTLYLRTYADAPRGRILALDLRRPDLKNARTVVPEPPSGVLLDYTLGRDAIYAEVREGFSVRLRRFAAGTPPAGEDVAPQLAGSAFALSDAAHAYDDVMFETSAWTAPSRVMQVATHGEPRDTGLRRSRMPEQAPEVQVTEVVVPSHDGAPVPLAILHKKGIALDGRNPTLLIGYGAYGFSFEAFFDPRNLAWIEKGGVLAFANVRGSGVYGDAWYRAGFKTTKSNTWKDGIACARYLQQKGYASPQTTGIWGTSAGGIFVGRSVTTAPELFAAAVFDVGIMDAVRAEQSANGVTNISEFGTVKNPDEFRALLDMSTYHQIKDGVAYPAVLFIHGMNDPRVDVWQSAKAAARLQAASISGKPILLRLDEQAGHGVGSTAQQGFSKLADIYSFLLWQFGMTPPAGSAQAR
jgi:prolyl oligopeptidase